MCNQMPFNRISLSRHQENSTRAGETQSARKVNICYSYKSLICQTFSYSFFRFLDSTKNSFLENKDDIAKVRKCFAGLWNLEDSSIVKDAIERPGLYVMKPQREGGGMISEIATLMLPNSLSSLNPCDLSAQGTIFMETM